MKTLLLAAAVLSLGLASARAETKQDAMPDKMAPHDTMKGDTMKADTMKGDTMKGDTMAKGGDAMPMKDAPPKK